MCVDRACAADLLDLYVFWTVKPKHSIYPKTSLQPKALHPKA